MVGAQHAAGIRYARGRYRDVVVDDVTAEDRKLDLVDELGVRRARLGELPGDAAELDDRNPRPVRQDHGHLQNHLQLVPDPVGREVVEGLGAIPGLKKEGPAGRNLAERAGEAPRLAGEHERRERRELGQGVGERGGVRPWRLLGSRVAPPGTRVPAGLRRRLCGRGGVDRRDPPFHGVRCGRHATSVGEERASACGQRVGAVGQSEIVLVS